MRLHGFMTVRVVILSIITSTASALPRTKFTAKSLNVTTISTPSITGLSQDQNNYGRQASPDTSVSTSTKAAAEYARPESPKEACNCDYGHGSIDAAPSMSTPASTSATPTPYMSPSFATARYSVPTSILPASTSVQQSQIIPTALPQYYSVPEFGPSQYRDLPAPTTLDPQGVASTVSPGVVPAIMPTTITAAAALPTGKDIDAQIAAGGQPWYQETYWECVTWRADYVHCGWHVPLRMGENPDSSGETFVYGAVARNGVGFCLRSLVTGGVVMALAL